ncbi:MAG: type II toxin-antitoxin system VapB family antitoxin [Verrucomicrobiae bacterium]|nr:type II toxin-antitoxin system VapB family antitoxin [Verrucomicrobiae bacterium]
MKTTIDIPDGVLKEAMRFTKAKTKREAVVTAVEDFNRRHRLAALAKRLHGSMPNFMTQAELQARREDSKWEAKP